MNYLNIVAKNIDSSSGFVEIQGHSAVFKNLFYIQYLIYLHINRIRIKVRVRNRLRVKVILRGNLWSALGLV